MPKKLPSDVLTYRDLQIFNLHEQKGKTLDETAEELGISRDTVKRTKRKLAYRDLVLTAMEEQGFQVEDNVKRLILLTQAEKEINVGGDIRMVNDNTTQMKAVEKIGKIYGDNAPLDLEISGNLTKASDGELFEELAEASERFGVDVESGESGEDEGDTPEIKGTVL